MRAEDEKSPVSVLRGRGFFNMMRRNGYLLYIPREEKVMPITRITFDPHVMGGKPCIRGMRVTVGMIVGMMAAGRDRSEILKLYPYLESQDIDEALAYAAWRVEEIDIPFAAESV
jgi:uncharacterized protein (DUF433 family)